MPSSGTCKNALLLNLDSAFRDVAGEVLDQLGIPYRVLGSLSDPVASIVAEPPDILLLDGGLPEMLDSGLIEKLRGLESPQRMKCVVLASAGDWEHRQRAFELGVDEVIPKPCAPEILREALDLIERFEATFWGIRGTLPIPGRATLRFGGNTSCISLSIGYGRHFIFDAGTGLRVLSDRIMAQTRGRFHGRLFISHPHWDHFNCLPFFEPLYSHGNHIVVHGPPQGDRSLRDLIDDQMDGTFFPITVEEFDATVQYQDIHEGTHELDGIQVIAKRLRHPGLCLAYRINHRGHSFAYVTDNELGQWESGETGLLELAAFLRDVDILIHDCTYFDDEYPNRINWGHSTVEQVTRLAHEAGAGCFYLFHHDPSHADEDVERKLAIAEGILAALGSRTRCRIAAEGQSVRLDRP